MAKAVIFLPGIKGTKLYDSNTMDGDILWQDVRYNFKDVGRLELSSEFEEFHYEEDFETIVKPLAPEPLAYNQFWKSLKLDDGYKFLFPYDWRHQNSLNGNRLKEFMEYLIDKSKAIGNPITAFDIVTHSMGNMPVRSYIQKNGMGLINKVIFVTPPFKGSPNAISALVIGQGWFFKRDEMRKLARTLPALFELLPTYDNYAINSGDSSSIDLWNIDNWQENLTEEKSNHSAEKKRIIKKFKENIPKAKEQLDELEGWMNELSEEEKDRILVLVKTEMKTLHNVVVEPNPSDDNPRNFFDFERSLIHEEGDGVVPNSSSCCYYDQLVTYCFENRALADDFKHPFILRDNRVQHVINNFLNCDESASEFNHNIFGRTVHRVIGLNETEVPGDGVKHKILSIKKA